jgi:hypothetical protein
MYFKLLPVVAVLLTALAFASADFCTKGRVEIQGNWLCQPVDAITYSNVGTPGTYQDIIDMSSDGTCSSISKSFSGPIAPLDEEVNPTPIFATSIHQKLTDLLTDLLPLPWSSPS